MWKNKRPEGWKNPHSCLGQRTKNHRKYDAYEAGADAMLEALQPYFEKVMLMCKVVRPLLDMPNLDEEDNE